MIAMLPPNTVCAQAAPTCRTGPASRAGTLRATDFDADGSQAGSRSRLPERPSLRRGKAPGTGLLATLLVTLLAALLVTGCGNKTPLELPKRVPPAKSAS